MIAPDAWRPVAIEILEPGAKAAITLLKGNAVVIANPGSGKTELLAQRSDFLFKTGVCRYPKRILAISFKTDAAHTLRKRVRERSGFEYAHRIDSLTFHAFARRLIQIYRPLLIGADRLAAGFGVGLVRVGDTQVAFKELVPLAQKLIGKHPMVKRSVAGAYSHVFLDEFQDCTAEQYELITSLFKGTTIGVTAVGDAKQRIMGWAGALDGVMEMFAIEFGAARLALVHNWRSAPVIRRVQNRMIKRMEPASAVDEKEIGGDAGVVYLSGFEDEQAEALFIAERIQAWIEEGIPAHEIAILHIRQSELFNQPIAVELDRRGIQYRNEQELQDLASEPLAELVIGLLRVLGKEPAPDAYAFVLHALSSDDDDNQGDWVRKLHRSRDAVAKVHNVEQAKRALEEVRVLIGSLSSASTLALSSDYDAGRIEELLAKIYSVLTELVDKYRDLDKVVARFRDEGSVRVMTIHKCKGMEFECVIMPCTESETWWGSEIENRSSFFVGISRAKQCLAVTHASRRIKPDGLNGRWINSRQPQSEFLSYLKKEASPL